MTDLADYIYRLEEVAEGEGYDLKKLGYSRRVQKEIDKLSEE